MPPLSSGSVDVPVEPKELQHPLGPKLHKAFRALSAANGDDAISAAQSELQAIVEDDAEIMLHRSHAVNTTHKGLGRYISRWLAALTVPNPSAAISAIQCLQSVEFVDESTRTVLFAKLLSQVIVASDIRSEMSLKNAVRAAETWGTLLEGESWLIPAIVDAELRQAIEWLCFDPTGRRRFVANIMLQQVAIKSPASFVPQLENVIRGAWDALRDDHLPTRVATAMSLKLVLQLGTSEQHSASLTVNVGNLWSELLDMAAKLMVVSQKETRHGGLLAMQAVLLVAVERGGESYPEINRQSLGLLWDQVLALLPEGNLPDFVYVALTDLLPIMAQYSKSWFIARCIPLVVPASSAVFRDDKSTLAERAQMFLVIGRLAMVLREHVVIFAERVIRSIELNLVTNPKTKRERCDAAVSCLAMLARADPSTIRPFVIPMMDLIFAGQPTLSFATDVQSLCTVFKELQSMCLDRMIGLLRTKLVVAPSAQQGTPANETSLTLMLEALSALDFTGYSVLPFLVDRVLPHLASPSSRVRTSAATCCAKLVFSGCRGWKSPCKLDAQGAVEHQGRLHIDLVIRVQNGLLNMAVADSDGDVRLLALQLLRPEFDITLASQEPCRTLFPALSDKPAIRHCAMRLLGRLSRRNPGCVFPMLRRTIIQCSTELRFLDHVRRQEHAATLLGTLVDAAPALVAPYAPALLQDMTMKLTACDPPTPTIVVTAVLATIHRLVLHAPPECIEDVRTLTAVVVRHVLDEGPQQKRIEAVRAITSIVRATHEVDLYVRYPTLLSTLTSMLHGGHKQSWSVRHEVLKLLGVIGAVDPARVKSLNSIAATDNSDSASGATTSTGAGGPISFTRGHDDEVVARYALHVALSVVSQPSVDDECCKQATRALVRIFDTRKLHLRASVQALRRVIPEVLKQIHARPKIREDLFAHLAMFTVFVSQHVRTFLSDIYSVVAAYIGSDEGPVVRTIVYLVVELRHHLNEEFAPYVPHLLPLLVHVCDTRQNDVQVMISVLDAFQHFGSLLMGHLHVVLPCILEAASDTTADIDVRLHALRAIQRLATTLPSMVDHASRSIHTLCRVLSEVTPPSSRHDHRDRARQIQSEAFEALRAIIDTLGPRYAKYDHTVRPIVAEQFRGDRKEIFEDFVRQITEVLTGKNAPETRHYASIRADRFAPLPNPLLASQQDFAEEGQQIDPRFTAAVEHLGRLSNLSEDEWSTWLRQFCIALLGDCQSTALRVCLGLARVHEPSARQLFHPAFATCFNAMAPDLQRLVVSRLGGALENPRTPKEVIQELLNLAEYMERAETFKRAGAAHQSTVSAPVGARQHQSTDPLAQLHAGIFSLKTLVAQSERCNLHAKALHYAEIQFNQIQTDIQRTLQGRHRVVPQDMWKNLFDVAEKLIGLNTKLGKGESANGILEYVKTNFHRVTGDQGSDFRSLDMYEKLQWWSEALRHYKQLNRVKPAVQHVAGMLRSLDALGDFQAVAELWKNTLRARRNRKEVTALAPYAARSAWLLQRWDDLDEATALMPAEGYEATTNVFYRAMLAMRRKDPEATRSLIAECRFSLDRDLSAVIAESYDRAYPLIVGLQQLSELEELAAIGTSAAMSLPRLSVLWKARLEQMSTSAVEWQGTLANHAMAIPPDQDLHTWLRFVTICVRSQRFRMAESVLLRLLGGAKSVASALARRSPPQPVKLAISASQFMFEAVSTSGAVTALEEYTTLLEDAGGVGNEIAECFTRLASWRVSLQPDYFTKQDDFAYVMSALGKALRYDPHFVAARRAWAAVNKECAATAMQFSRGGAGAAAAAAEVEQFALNAIDGFLRCVEAETRLEDVLGLLSMWFTYGGRCPKVSERIAESLPAVPNDAWLRVIPQIVARIHTPQKEITDGVRDLLRSIAEHHPQALLFALNVNMNAIAQGLDVAERRRGAEEVLGQLRRTHGAYGALMTDHAQLVSQELIRCAVMWIEEWFEAIDEAWRLFNTPPTVCDVKTMASVFEPLLLKLDHPRTPADNRFVADYGQEVRAAVQATRAAVERVKATGPFTRLEDAPPEVKTAWEIFTKEHDRMGAELKPLMSLAVQYVSPDLEALCSSTDAALSLVIPGHYQPGGACPRVRGFESTLKVMGSKNRPRRVVIISDNGQQYKHLLKGQEDMRLDERCMQLLGLVNTVLEANLRTAKLDMQATTYAVTPLSDNVGLVSWVDHCDTLNEVIRLYREATGIPTTREFRLMQSQCDSLEALTLMQKVEVLEFALENTDGMDIARVMWARSSSTESWLDCRTSYVRTLGSQSMIGYVLGLGDRHPSNLMLARTGRIVHIDFGDCFEVAMLRANTPERVPFRLTRMLQKAMETGGIDGIFRHTCEAAMSVLRLERDNLMAMLEAFVHDPLITWRLIADEGAESERTSGAADAVAGLRLAPTAGQHVTAASFVGAGTLGRRVAAASEFVPGSQVQRPALQSVKPARLGGNAAADQAVASHIRRAQEVVERIRDKLMGKEDPRIPPRINERTTKREEKTVKSQVDRLIRQASSNENLCQSYHGWCPFW